MKIVSRLIAFIAFAAGITGIPTSPAMAFPGQDFPGVKCTCKGCGPNGGDVSGQCASVCKDKTVYSKGSEPLDYCKASGLVATGANLRAAMALAGINAATLGRTSDLSPATVNRLLGARRIDSGTRAKLVRGLQRNGVEIAEDGVRLIQKPRR